MSKIELFDDRHNPKSASLDIETPQGEYHLYCAEDGGACSGKFTYRGNQFSVSLTHIERRTSVEKGWHYVPQIYRSGDNISSAGMKLVWEFIDKYLLPHFGEVVTPKNKIWAKFADLSSRARSKWAEAEDMELKAEAFLTEYQQMKEVAPLKRVRVIKAFSRPTRYGQETIGGDKSCIYEVIETMRDGAIHVRDRSSSWHLDAADCEFLND